MTCEQLRAQARSGFASPEVAGVRSAVQVRRPRKAHRTQRRMCFPARKQLAGTANCWLRYLWSVTAQNGTSRGLPLMRPANMWRRRALIGVSLLAMATLAPAQLATAPGPESSSSSTSTTSSSSATVMTGGPGEGVGSMLETCYGNSFIPALSGSCGALAQQLPGLMMGTTRRNPVAPACTGRRPGAGHCACTGTGTDAPVRAHAPPWACRRQQGSQHTAY